MSDPQSQFRWREAEAEAEGGNVTVGGSRDAADFGFTEDEEEKEEEEEGLTGTPAIRGNLDAIAFDFRLGWVARGWAVDDFNPESPVEIEIVEGDTILGRGVAAQFRQDLEEAGIGTRCGGFRHGAFGGDAEREQHVVTVRRADSNVVIVPPSPVRITRFIGFLDGVESAVVVGWVCDAARSGTPVAVEMIVDDMVIGHAIADQFRADLSELGLGNASYGFEWLLPARFADGQPHRFVARVANTDVYLDSTITDFLILPDRLTPEARSLFDKRDATKEHLSVIEQALKTEARRRRSTEILTMTDLLLDSLDPPPVFQIEPVPVPASSTEIQPD